jgi:hypothetical protein
MQNSQLNEGLRPNDLKEMISSIFEVDAYRSKMGEDRDVVVLSFTAADRNPAKDLMEFIEKGYSFVLDADVSSGENKNGEYYVFVELARNEKLAEHIKELTYGINRLTGIDEFKFKYHKSSLTHPVKEDVIRKIVPSNASSYEEFLSKAKTESVKSFFNKTIMNDLTLVDDVITIHRPFDKKVQLKWLDEPNSQTVVEGNVNVDPEATAEIFWLTKVLGDYNISKFDDKLLFVNGERAMLLQRI